MYGIYFRFPWQSTRSIIENNQLESKHDTYEEAEADLKTLIEWESKMGYGGRNYEIIPIEEGTNQ